MQNVNVLRETDGGLSDPYLMMARSRLKKKANDRELKGKHEEGEGCDESEKTK